MASTETRLRELATALGTDWKLLTGKIGDLATLSTTAKASLVAALNELKTLVDNAASAPEVNDAATNNTNTWSSQKISDQITAAITALATGAPAALNTLDELAAALNDDPNAITALTTAVANRLRYDAAQTLTAPQKVQGNANLGSLSLVQAGDPDADLVAAYNAAKA